MPYPNYQRPPTPPQQPDDFFQILRAKLTNVKTVHTLCDKCGVDPKHTAAILIAASNDYAATKIAASINNLAEAIRSRGATRN